MSEQLCNCFTSIDCFDSFFLEKCTINEKIVKNIIRYTSFKFVTNKIKIPNQFFIIGNDINFIFEALISSIQEDEQIFCLTMSSLQADQLSIAGVSFVQVEVNKYLLHWFEKNVQL